jgi:hypothetical protein
MATLTHTSRLLTAYKTFLAEATTDGPTPQVVPVRRLAVMDAPGTDPALPLDRAAGEASDELALQEQVENHHR